MSDELEEGTASIASDIIPNPDSFGEVGEFGHDVVEEPNDYQFWAADINGDGDLNVLDVVLLVDLILD